MRFLIIVLFSVMSLVAMAHQADDSQRPLPKEVRGYKVHRARVEPKNESNASTRERKATTTGDKDEYDEQEPLLIRLGDPALVKVTPLGVTFDIPVILAPVKQSGDVERLVFEDMRVNDIPVTLRDYEHKFKLPNKDPLTLSPSIRVFVSTPQAVLRTIDEIFNSRAQWPVTGRVYVCGRFKKLLFKFKRAVPVELNTAIRNPTR